jgi:hypothetical protein
MCMFVSMPGMLLIYAVSHELHEPQQANKQHVSGQEVIGPEKSRSKDLGRLEATCKWFEC